MTKVLLILLCNLVFSSGLTFSVVSESHSNNQPKIIQIYSKTEPAELLRVEYYYEVGSIRKIENYKDSVLHDLLVEYDQMGRIQFKGYYEEGYFRGDTLKVFDDYGKMISEHAEEASHMFFASGVTSLFSNIMSTHPNLTNRIKVLDPHFNGQFDEIQSAVNMVEEGASSSLVKGDMKLATDSEKVFNSVGSPSSDHVNYAADILRNIPEDVIRAAHEPFSARSVIYCLLLDKNEAYF